MATSNDLIQDVYANFLSAYAHVMEARNTVIAFEDVGLSPNIDPSANDSKAAALEYISNEANWVPDLSSGTYERTMRTISVTYTNMLSASAPLSEDSASIFNALKASGMEAIHNFDLGSENGASTFKPAYAAPQNWFDGTQTAGWSSYSYTATQAAPQTPPPPLRPPVWRMRISPSLVFSPASVGSSAAAQTSPAQEPAPGLGVPSQFFGNGSSNEATQRTGTSPALRAADDARYNQRVAVNSEMLHLSPLVLNNSGEQPILPPTFSMAFQYCIVQLTRPWYSGDLLANDQWYVPGQHSGDFATGPVPGQAIPVSASPASAPTTVANTGPFAWIPTAFIAIKNLVIRATDGSLDPSVSKSVTSFGPFSLTPGQSSDTLSNAGVEIIAWICSAQPQLPPQTDPALVSPSDDVTTDVKTALDTLGGLFGKNF